MLFRKAMERRSDYESVDLNDRRLLEMLGIEVGDINVRGKAALKVETVYACIRIRSESVAKLPLKVYQEDENNIQKATKHGVYSLLKLRPNPLMSAFDFWKCVEAQGCMYGNAYVYIDFDRRTGKVMGLWPVNAERVKIIVDDGGVLGESISNRSKLWYEVDVGKGQKRKVMPDSMLHFKSGITVDGIAGISPLDYLKSTLENAASAGKFINNFYKNGLQTKGLIQYSGSLDEPAKRVFKENFESMSSGLNNSHRISLLPIGYQFTPISLSMTDAQFLENTELTIRQLAAAYGIKMHQLNDLSKATHTNIEQQQQQFYTDTLQAILTMYEQEMTFKLFSQRELDAGHYTRFNVDAILRADIKTRYTAYKDAIQGGFMSPNQARAKEEWEPLEGGDQLYVNGNMIPLVMAGQQYVKGGDGTGEGEKGSEGDSGTAGDSGDS